MNRDEIKLIDEEHLSKENGRIVIIFTINKNDLGKFLEQLKLNKNNKSNKMMLSDSRYINGTTNWYEFKNYRNNKNGVELIFRKSKEPEDEKDKYEWNFVEREYGKNVNVIRLIENENEYIKFWNKNFGKEKNDVNNKSEKER